MNRENMQRLIDLLNELPDERFTMLQFGGRDINKMDTLADCEDTIVDYSPHTCGTAACIGGWAALMFAKDNKMTPEQLNLCAGSDCVGRERAGQMFLALNDTERSSLFYCTDYVDAGYRIDSDYSITYNLSIVTRKQAIQACENMLEYGEPRWGEILQEEEVE